VSEHREFHYRLPHRIGGWRPGSHRGSSLGGTQEFVSHLRLYDRPDPRRLDLRASLRNIQQDWLVRVNRQRSSIPVHAVIDVSASMTFGSHRSKLEVAAEFIESLGRSTFRLGDSLGMLAFDEIERTDLFVPARVGRGVGDTMAGMLRDTVSATGEIGGGDPGRRGDRQLGRTLRPRESEGSRPLQGSHGPQGSQSHGLQGTREPHGLQGAAGLRGAERTYGLQGLRDVIQHLAGRRGLVFVVSDFHWPLDEGTRAALESLSHSFVVPVVVWNPAEMEAPARDGLAQIRDVESDAQRTVWIRRRIRQDWRDSVEARRRELDRLFTDVAMRPFYMIERFDSEALSKYFFEVAA
jgi:hypothetical protein